jgi:hypothetical protein
VVGFPPSSMPPCGVTRDVLFPVAIAVVLPVAMLDLDMPVHTGRDAKVRTFEGKRKKVKLRVRRVTPLNPHDRGGSNEKSTHGSLTAWRCHFA